MIVRLALLSIFLLSACSSSNDVSAFRPGPHSYPAGACHVVGNRQDRQYCVTTAAQLLANPGTYDGRLIQVRGWVTSWHGHAYLYLSREMLDGADSYGSLAVEGPGVAEIIKAVGVSGPHNPGRSLLVGGRFFLSRPSQEAEILPSARDRFGVLRESDTYRP